MNSKGFLILEDGSVFEGLHLNNCEDIGEVVFNTSHSGYEEMATDPSYFKQILVSTAPMQGNYGVHDEFCESSRLHIAGSICLEMQNSKRDSSWLRRLTDHGVPVLAEVDTRKLVLSLREKGVVWGGVFKSNDVTEALKQIKEEKQKWESLDWTALVSVKNTQTLKGDKPEGPKVGLFDFGFKQNILRELLSRSSEVTIFPSDTGSLEILKSGINGLMLSNGPGDPALVVEPVKEIKNLIGKLPIMGICMGHQLLSMALGLKTFKLKFGHRGANHPIHNLVKDFVYVSSQNHGYAVEGDFKALGVEVTHYNLNDKTVAGIRSEKENCFSVQFHPESHPGPHEAVYLFDDFVDLISSVNSSNKNQKGAHV